jgi:small subunit ribosomal protein S6
MPLYELGLVLSPELGDEERSAFLSELRDLIGGEGGEITKEDAWGKRALAYEINHQREGFYLFWQVEAPGTMLQPLEYKLRLSDQALRYLVLNLDREMSRARKMDRIKAEKKASKSRESASAAEETAATAGEGT